jgi:hyaluronan synthase
VSTTERDSEELIGWAAVAAWRRRQDASSDAVSPADDEQHENGDALPDHARSIDPDGAATGTNGFRANHQADPNGSTNPANGQFAESQHTAVNALISFARPIEQSIHFPGVDEPGIPAPQVARPEQISEPERLERRADPQDMRRAGAAEIEMHPPIVARPEGGDPGVSARDAVRDPDLRGRHRRMGGLVPPRVAPQEVTRGALAPSYYIPRATLRRSHAPIALAVGSIAAALLLSRHVDYIWHHPGYRWVLGAWMTGTTMVIVQWLLSWLDRSPRLDEQPGLDRLYVAISMPVYNEDPRILDRTLWAAINQERRPQRIDVVDDGSVIDYTALRAHWEGEHNGCVIRWIRQANGGKKAAQARTFSDPGSADIIVTVDSDSALESSAIRRGLTQFADPRVQSVAGMELAYNFRHNWLTRTVYARTLFFQVVACGAQSAFGDVLVNRGPFAMYRADLLAETCDAYTQETFWGRRIKLGDDAALTLFARGRGRAVQQSDAFVFSMFPEKLSHHLRQWTRWMRGSTIRNCWRIRYLPVLSYAWWYTFVSAFLFLMAIAGPVCMAVTWPTSEGVVLWTTGALVPWAWLSGMRVLAVRRSDERGWSRLITWACYPTSILWMMFVLHWVRVWSILTFLRQGWQTRQHGAESLTVAEADNLTLTEGRL